MPVFVDSQSPNPVCSGFSVSKWITSLETTPCRIGLGMSQKLTWMLQQAACCFPLDLLSFFHTNRKSDRFSVCEMGACISIITEAIKVFFIGGTNKKSYEFHSWKHRNSGASIIQPISQQSTKCFLFRLIITMGNECRR